MDNDYENMFNDNSCSSTEEDDLEELPFWGRMIISGTNALGKCVTEIFEDPEMKETLEIAWDLYYQVKIQPKCDKIKVLFQKHFGRAKKEGNI